MKKYLFFLLLAFNSFIYAQDTLRFTDLYGDYLGQMPPGDTPVVFARDIVSTKDLEHSAAIFSPEGNEVFWHVNRPPGPNNTEWINFTKNMRRIDGRWTEPELSLMKHPFFTSDWKLIYFIGDGNGPYYSIRQDDGWSKWQRIDLLDRYPELEMIYITSITLNGSIYFTGKCEGLGTLHNHAIYRSELIDGLYTKPEILPRQINLPPFNNWTPYISPDEDYLIFSSNRTGSLDNFGDLYISFRLPEGNWTDPVNMGTPINTHWQERLPSVTPDRKYLFFTRWTPDYDQDVFWVNAKIIDRLKEKYNFAK